MSQYALGLDGGGTQTRAAIARTGEPIAGRGLAGPCNLAAVALPDALAAALAAADLALTEAGGQRADVGALCAGVAGASFTQRRDEFAQALQAAFPQAQVAVEPDYAIALTGATGGEPGVIVIAGTGSAAYGENALEERHKTGAYGYLIDDAGSGYGAGRAALAAILRAADGTGEPTSLSERIPAALNLGIADLIPSVYGGSLSRVTIASLSRILTEAAEADNDAVARTLLMRAGGALAQLTQGVTSRLFAAAAAPYPVALIGGLWNAGAVLTDVYFRSLHRFAPLATVIPPVHTPVEGAVQKAAKMLAAS